MAPPAIGPRLIAPTAITASFSSKERNDTRKWNSTQQIYANAANTPVATIFFSFSRELVCAFIMKYSYI